MPEIFKICPCCQKKWTFQNEFITDSGLELIGYTPDFKKLTKGIFYFNHKIDGCFSTLACEAKDFLNLYNGPYYKGLKTDTENCPGYCHERDQLARCEAFCEGAFVREIGSIIREKQQVSKK